MLGMIITIYHPPHGDCNSTVTRDQPEALLVGPGIPALFEARGRPVLKLATKTLWSTGEQFTYLLPVEARNGGGMFGGNFGYSSDSRFPSRYPLKIHDGQ